MGQENIEKYSPLYALLKSPAYFWHNRIFYRKVIVLGSDVLNEDGHFIFAPNHQNALMDALAILFTSRGQPVFLARADIFKNKFIASILYFLKILPVYRIRDGMDYLKENDRIFNKTVDVLRNKNGLVILPEGDQEARRRLRQLKKGICRIAFQADEASGFIMNIKIIPVGLEFTHYSRIRQVLTIVYGKPVEVNEFHTLYMENPQRAMAGLKTRLSAEMKKIMVHIESEEDYEAIDELRSIINGRFSDDLRNPKLFRDRSLIASLNTLKNTSEGLYERICTLSIFVKRKSAEMKTDYRLLEKGNITMPAIAGGIAALIATFPLFAYGTILNYVFYLIPNLTLRKVSDEHFHGSVRYAISLLLAFLFMPVYLILALSIISPWWMATGIFLTIPAAGIFAWNYYLLSRRISGSLRIRNYLKSRNSDYLALRNSYDELNSLVSGITQKS